MFIIAPDAGAAHESEQELSIQVVPANLQKDLEAVEEAISAIEKLQFEAVSQSSAPDEKTALAIVQAMAQAVCPEGVQAQAKTVSYQAPEAGSAKNLAGTDGQLTFTIIAKRNEASSETAQLTLAITAVPWQMQAMELNTKEGSEKLSAGKPLRVWLDQSEDYAIEGVNYTTDNPHVSVDAQGNLVLDEDYVPASGETVTVSAEVSYVDPTHVHFADSFEGEKKFSDADLYAHSDKDALFGRKAATSQGTANGYPSADLGSLSDVRVSAWYYDANGGASQTKFGFGINGNSTALGVFYDGVIAPYVNNLTLDHYGARVQGFTYNDYSWGATSAPRSEGWHHFEWIVSSENGLTEKVDGKVISTNRIAGKTGTDHNLVPVENLENVKEVNSLTLMEGWNNNATNRAEIADRHFIDGVFVADLDAPILKTTVVSRAIELQDTDYTTTPSSLSVNSTWPSDQSVLIAPYTEGKTEVSGLRLDDQAVDASLWSAGMQSAPVNAQNYPAELAGYALQVDKEAFKDLAEGSHTLQVQLSNGRVIRIPVTAAAETHQPQNYYLSNTGNDSNDGHTPQSAWKSFEKLQSVTFGPGDHIYLDAQSAWSNVQFRPSGSGAPGAPVVLTRYNQGDDDSLRPVLNGDGTNADLDAHSYLAFDAWRSFYPSGTIELFNVEQWEISGIEITNYASEMTKGATGRNGIAVIYDYFETQGLTSLPSSNADREKAFYRAGKLQHIDIQDCYIHDVTGYHPANGAVGRGGKMSGGINIYGPYDDLNISNNIVMYCDVEGIRNDVLAWMGDTRTQFPAYMKDIRITNNYIAGVPGDGVVISSADKPVIENNYLTDAGYSYFAENNRNTVSGVTWNASDLASCRRVEEKTGTKNKPMGNRSNPITMGATNFAGLWFIGTKDAAAQYNEATNNVWTCNDGEAFDADMFCSGTVFQYNYTYRNNGGFCLFMPTMDQGTVVRYNVSVEDGLSVGIAEGQNGLFHYIGTPELIHNNVFLLSDRLATIFGGGSNTAYFYNNIVAAPNGLLQTGTFNGFHINGSSDGAVSNPALGGEMKNNLFYPAAIVNSVASGSSVKLENNITLNDASALNEVFEDLPAFMEAQPVKALKGRSDFGNENNPDQKASISAEAGRGIQVPAGGFDLSQFETIRLSENSPAAQAGTAVMRSYSYQAQNDAAWPLTEDFFGNAIRADRPMDIGVHQSSSQERHVHDYTCQKPEAAYLAAEANCTHAARYFFSCTCGKTGTETFEHGEALGHDSVIIPAKKPTNTQSGLTEGSYCARCGEILQEQQVIPAVLDLSVLQMLLAASEKSADNPAAYAKAGFDTFANTREQALQIEQNPESQEQIDAAVASLHQAWMNLRLLPDKSLLEELSAAA